MTTTITPRDLAELVKGLGIETRNFVAESLAPLIAQQDEVIRRLRALEKRRTMEFEGPHDPSREYRPGSVVQHAGAVWVCMITTSEVPGASSAWRRIAGDAR